MATHQRIGISENLPTGATYEILVIDHPDGYPEGKIDFKFAETPRKITGIQKVAQMFMKVLLTNRGSDVLYPQLGTAFPDIAVNANRTSNDRDFHAALINEIKTAERQCIAILNTTDSDDASSLDRVTIIAVDITKEAAVIYLKITTLAGATAQVAVPFPELDMKLSEA